MQIQKRKEKNVRAKVLRETGKEQEIGLIKGLLDGKGREVRKEQEKS